MGDKNTTDFVSYMDEYGKHKEAYVTFLEINPSFVKFKTYSDNIIIIPMIRVLKIKIKEGSEFNG